MGLRFGGFEEAGGGWGGSDRRGRSGLAGDRKGLGGGILGISDIWLSGVRSVRMFDEWCVNAR